MEEARPRQPGDMIRETHARINVGTEITNRGGWLNWNATDDDRVEESVYIVDRLIILCCVLHEFV